MDNRTRSVDIEDIIANLPRDEQLIVKRLRALVKECIPEATEKTYYDFQIPFYTRNRLICFIWPPSLSDKNSAKYEERKSKGVSLGFNQGWLMSNEDGVLLEEGRKQVYVMYFNKLDDIDEAQVRALLFEAALVDEQFAKAKKNEKR